MVENKTPDVVPSEQTSSEEKQPNWLVRTYKKHPKKILAGAATAVGVIAGAAYVVLTNDGSNSNEKSSSDDRSNLATDTFHGSEA